MPDAHKDGCALPLDVKRHQCYNHGSRALLTLTAAPCSQQISTCSRLPQARYGEATALPQTSNPCSKSCPCNALPLYRGSKAEVKPSG
jgi:hypothetical protein